MGLWYEYIGRAKWRTSWVSTRWSTSHLWQSICHRTWHQTSSSPAGRWPARTSWPVRPQTSQRWLKRPGTGYRSAADLGPCRWPCTPERCRRSTGIWRQLGTILRNERITPWMNSVHLYMVITTIHLNYLVIYTRSIRLQFTTHRKKMANKNNAQSIQYNADRFNVR